MTGTTEQLTEQETPTSKVENVVFDRLEANGPRQEAKGLYRNQSGDLGVGQSGKGYSSGVCRISMRFLSPCGIRRLGFTSKNILTETDKFVCPDAEDLPVRLILPLNMMLVNGVEYHAKSELLVGTEVHLELDLDKLTVVLRLGTWDSGEIKITAPSLKRPLYAYFIMDDGDAFELLSS